MGAQHARQQKPLASVSTKLKALFGQDKPEDEDEPINPVEEIREGLKDLKDGRVTHFRRTRDLLKDE